MNIKCLFFILLFKEKHKFIYLLIASLNLSFVAAVKCVRECVYV